MRRGQGPGRAGQVRPEAEAEAHLEPDLHLPLGELQLVRDLDAPLARQVSASERATRCTLVCTRDYKALVSTHLLYRNSFSNSSVW